LDVGHCYNLTLMDLGNYYWNVSSSGRVPKGGNFSMYVLHTIWFLPHIVTRILVWSVIVS
jgi:hypothetical protein